MSSLGNDFRSAGAADPHSLAVPALRQEPPPLLFLDGSPPRGGLGVPRCFALSSEVQSLLVVALKYEQDGSVVRHAVDQRLLAMQQCSSAEQNAVRVEIQGNMTQQRVVSFTTMLSNFFPALFQRPSPSVFLTSQCKCAHKRPARFEGLLLESHEGTAMDMESIIESQLNT